MLNKVYFLMLEGDRAVFASRILKVSPVPDSEKVRVSFFSNKVHEYTLSGRDRILEFTNPEPGIEPVLLRDSFGYIRYVREPVIYYNRDCGTAVVWKYERGGEALYGGVIRGAQSDIRDRQLKTVLRYLNDLADADTVKDGETGEASRVLSFSPLVKEGSLFYQFCSPEKKAAGTPGLDMTLPVIFPFGCNASQLKAVTGAMSNRLSVIQGPPGTGKTQTILNIIANLVIRGKTVMVVSNNNAAPANVADKLEKEGLGFIVARLGNRENREAFFAGQPTAPVLDEGWDVGDGEMDRLAEELSSSSENLAGYFAACNERAVLVDERYHLGIQMDLAGEDTGGRPGLAARIFGSERIRRLLARWDSLPPGSRERLPLAMRAEALLLGLGRHPDRKAAEHTAHLLYLRELEKRISGLEAVIDRFEGTYGRFRDDSMRYFKGALYRRYATLRWRQFDADSFRDDAVAFRTQYPVVLSSTNSSSRNFSRKDTFDYVIMDEASQVGIVSGALSMSCGENMVVVGDSKQLPNIVGKETGAAFREIYEASELKTDGRYDPFRSFLSAVTRIFADGVGQVPVTLLQEHYRCSPAIIGFCSRQFYGGGLRIMSKDDGGLAPLVMIETAQGNHCADRVNRRESAEICLLVRDLRTKGFRDIGVISPYKDQRDEIISGLRESGISDVKVATVHGFQGQENDIIIFSVAADEVNEFVDDPQLLNVAVSRAKRQFCLVVTGNDIRDSNLRTLKDYISYIGEVRRGKVNSVFDLLYRQHSEELARFVEEHCKDNVSPYQSENIVYHLLRRMFSMEDEGTDSATSFRSLGVMFQYPLWELVKGMEGMDDVQVQFASNEWTKCDFLVYHRTSRTPLLVVEVDGYTYHRDPLQKRRDDLKDSILRKAGVGIVRLNTKGHSEAEKIKAALLPQMDRIREALEEK